MAAFIRWLLRCLGFGSSSPSLAPADSGGAPHTFDSLGSAAPDPADPAALLEPLHSTDSSEEVALTSRSDEVVTLEQRQVIESIVSVFETGTPTADYSAVVVLSDGAGITYGKHQSTDRSDSLDAIVVRYHELGGVLAPRLFAYLDRLDADETALADPLDLPVWVSELMMLLEQAGDTDPVMARAQDEVFDELYWQPAARQASSLGLVLPLSWLVVYDSTIHSGVNGVARIRKLFPEVPPSLGGDEQSWTRAYLLARRRWLASSSNPVVQNTVYRIDAMLAFVDAGNWNLRTPIHIERPPATIV